MKSVLLCFFFLSNTILACHVDKDIKQAVKNLVTAKSFESRYYGEAGLISSHHVYFEKIMASQDRIDLFEKLAKSEGNKVAVAYGLLGLWKSDNKKFRKLVADINLNQEIPCLFTIGPGKVTLKKLFETPEKTWRVFLFDRDLRSR